jgi:hypothetical protein
LVAIDLKLGKFKASDKAQMELYLNWLNKYERKESEETPVGLILCADKTDEHIELLELNKGNIRVAQYFTELPPKKILEQKLHKAWLAASEKSSRIERNYIKNNLRGKRAYPVNMDWVVQVGKLTAGLKTSAR